MLPTPFVLQEKRRTKRLRNRFSSCLGNGSPRSCPPPPSQAFRSVLPRPPAPCSAAGTQRSRLSGWRKKCCVGGFLVGLTIARLVGVATQDRMLRARWKGFSDTLSRAEALRRRVPIRRGLRGVDAGPTPCNGSDGRWSNALNPALGRFCVASGSVRPRSPPHRPTAPDCRSVRRPSGRSANWGAPRGSTGVAPCSRPSFSTFTAP